MKREEEITMTREQILAMEPGRELDKLVNEKLFGYIVRSHVGYEAVKRVDRAEFLPSTYLPDAWEVVEKLKLGKCLVTLVGDESKWGCRITAMVDVVYGVDVHDTQCAFESAPEAICKAALLAVMNL